MISSVAKASEGSALKWQEEKLEKQAIWSDRELVYEYRFINQSAGTVTIRDVAVSCGCTELDRTVLKIYQPGEQGRLKAKFRIDERTGKRIVTLMVESDEGGGGIYKLILVADIAELADVQPAFLHWSDSEAVSTKTVKLRWQGPGVAELISAVPSEPGWKTVIRPLMDGKSWELQVTPPTTKGDYIVQIPLRFRNSQTGERVVVVNAMLQPDPLGKIRQK